VPVGASWEGEWTTDALGPGDDSERRALRQAFLERVVPPRVWATLRERVLSVYAATVRQIEPLCEDPADAQVVVHFAGLGQWASAGRWLRRPDDQPRREGPLPESEARRQRKKDYETDGRLALGSLPPLIAALQAQLATWAKGSLMEEANPETDP
jgi:hypothetical protein